MNDLETMREAQAAAAQTRKDERRQELQHKAAAEPQTLQAKHKVLAKPPTILAALLNRKQKPQELRR